MFDKPPLKIKSSSHGSVGSVSRAMGGFMKTVMQPHSTIVSTAWKALGGKLSFISVPCCQLLSIATSILLPGSSHPPKTRQIFCNFLGVCKVLSGVGINIDYQLDKI